jgi:phospholipid/cholesterol/gamma-HCH transport system ATP-binding protein
MAATQEQSQQENKKSRGAISIINLNKSLNDKPVLKNINLEIAGGSILVILGVSGTGKTVLIKHINGLMKPDSGKVLIDGVEVTNMTEPQLDELRKNVGMVFQFGALINSLSVADNVALGMKENRMYSQEKIEAIVAEKLELVEMGDTADLFPPSLSGGMKKRVAFARSIATEPEVILYDEPSTGLDPITSEHIETIMININKRLKSTSIVVTHDLQCAFNIADMIAILHNGEVVEYCPPDCVRQSKNDFVQRFLRRHLSE